MTAETGKAGENCVASWLEERGYEILERNFHSRFGEIDIIAKRGTYIAFVEVKTRAPNSLVSPLEAITAAKQRKLTATAMEYLRQTAREGAFLLWKHIWKTPFLPSRVGRRSRYALL